MHPHLTQPDEPLHLKHWRHFGRQEWRHVGDGIKGFLLGSALPLISFYAALKWWNLSGAVLVVLGWSAVVFVWHRRRTGQSDVFSAVTFGFAFLEAIVGLVSQNVFLYLATPTLKNLVFAIAFLISAWANRPIVGLYAQRLYPIPPGVRTAPAYQHAFRAASVVWAVGLSLRGATRIWLLTTLPLELYLIVDNTLVGWSFSAVMISFTVWYPLRTLKRAGLMAASPVTLDAVEVAEEVTTVAATP